MTERPFSTDSYTPAGTGGKHSTAPLKGTMQRDWCFQGGTEPRDFFVEATLQTFDAPTEIERHVDRFGTADDHKYPVYKASRLAGTQPLKFSDMISLEYGRPSADVASDATGCKIDPDLFGPTDTMEKRELNTLRAFRLAKTAAMTPRDHESEIKLLQRDGMMKMFTDLLSRHVKTKKPTDPDEAHSISDTVKLSEVNDAYRAKLREWKTFTVASTQAAEQTVRGKGADVKYIPDSLVVRQVVKEYPRQWVDLTITGFRDDVQTQTDNLDPTTRAADSKTSHVPGAWPL